MNFCLIDRKGNRKVIKLKKIVAAIQEGLHEQYRK